MSLTATARSIPGTLRQDVLVDGRHHLTTEAAKSVGASFKAGPTVTVKWRAQATMADGTAIVSLSGFKVYGSRTRYDLAPALLATVTDPAAVSATVSGLTSGTWYFWVSATTSNAESELQYTSQASIP